MSESSNIVAGVLPATIMHFVANENTLFTIEGVTCATLFMVPWCLVYEFTWERTAVATNKHNTSLIIELKLIFINTFSTLRVRAFRLNLIMYIDVFVALEVFCVSFAY